MNKNILNNSFPEVPESFHNSLSKTLNSLPEREEIIKWLIIKHTNYHLEKA